MLAEDKMNRAYESWVILAMNVVNTNEKVCEQWMILAMNAVNTMDRECV